MKPVILAMLIGLAACPLGLAADEETDFKGNVVMVTLENDSAGYALTDAKLQAIGGRQFLAGIGADNHSERDWMKGTKVRIAFDRVVAIFVFTPKEYEDRARMRR